MNKYIVRGIVKEKEIIILLKKVVTTQSSLTLAIIFDDYYSNFKRAQTTSSYSITSDISDEEDGSKL